MQRLMQLRTGTSRLIQVLGNHPIKNTAFPYPKSAYISLFNRSLATKQPDVDPHADLYKPSTSKTEQHVPDDLKGGQSPETFTSPTASPLSTSGKVWSAQHPEGVHVAPLGGGQSTASIPSTPDATQKSHQTTVYSTKGGLNIADPFKTQTLQPEATPQQLAEAAAASAFEPFAPDAASSAPAVNEAVFAPKISSTDIYSTTTSPTAHFDSTVPSAGSTSTGSSAEPVKYETARKGKVYGGQDTSAESKKHPTDNPFNLKEKINPAQGK